MYQQFKPSALATEVEELDAVHHPHSIQVDHTNSMYSTDAENSIAPFLARNIAKDSKRRNYVIGKMGEVIYTEDDMPIQVPIPNERDAFGHKGEIGNRMSEPRKHFHEDLG